jgi:glycosyltransferase involved in cell wall biosynthesis
MFVSVIIPTKNRCALLRETLASVAAQTYPHWEAVVVDDGSTDGTVALVQSLMEKDHRVRYIRREHRPKGAPACRNIGAAAAQGKYVIFLDGDDLLASWCLEKRVEVMQLNSGVDFAIFQTKIFHNTVGDNDLLFNLPTEENDLDRFIRGDTVWQTAGPIWLKSSLKRIGQWDESARSWQDWEFHVRALIGGLRYLKVPEVDSYYRVGLADSISSSAYSPRALVSRARLLRRVGLMVQSKGEMSARRRHTFAMFLYGYAFNYGLAFKLGMKIWNAARRTAIINLPEYLIVVLLQVLAKLLTLPARTIYSLLNRFYASPASLLHIFRGNGRVTTHVKPSVTST